MTNTTITTLIDTINTRLAEENKPYTVKYELTNENNIFRDAIRVIPNDCTIDNILVCPVLYFDNKRTIDKWVQIIDHAYKTSEDIRKTHALHTKDRDFILSNIFTSIVDINNTEFLENKIYDTFLDFAVVYRIQNDKHSTCAVTKTLCNIHNFTMDEIRKAAVFNTAHDYEILDFLHREGLVSAKEDVPFVLLSNSAHNYGANTILNKDALNKACEYLKTDEIYCLPSSIDEILCLDATIGFKPEDLYEIVSMVNTTLNDEYVLNSSVYKYKYDNKVVKVV